MTYKQIAKRLWDLLDAIDTYSDMMKPEKTAYYNAVMARAGDRFKYMSSDGCILKRKWRRERHVRMNRRDRRIYIKAIVEAANISTPHASIGDGSKLEVLKQDKGE